VDWALIRRLSGQWRDVADCLLGDFYPLTSYQLNEELWLAWQFDLPERQKGVVQVFRRAGSNYESARFRLQNLDPTASYVVTDLDQPAAEKEYGGRELLERGISISAPERPSACILTYQVSTKGR
jgi:Glycosyl hydrolase family 36 C-terminal domain